MTKNPLPSAPSPFDRLLWPLMNTIFGRKKTDFNDNYSPLLRNMGNLLSLVRILSAVIFITFWFTLPTTNPLTAVFWTVIAVVWAGVTDALDGVFARYFRNSTGFGAILDPTMDKIAIFAFFITWGIVAWKISLIFFIATIVLLTLRITTEFMIVINAQKELKLTGLAKAGMDGKNKTGLDIAMIMPLVMTLLIMGHVSLVFILLALIASIVMLASCVLGLRAAYFHSDNVQAHYDKSREFTSY